MADNLTTTTTVSTVPNGTIIATRQGTYSGDANTHIAPTITTVATGSEGSYTFTDIDPRTGDVAHDAVDAGNPIKVGAKAVAHGSNPTAVAAADRTDLYANRHGVQFVIGGHPNQKSATWNATGAFTDDPLIAVVSSGTKIAVTRLTVTLDEATTVGVGVRIGFGTANVPALGASGADGVDDILFHHAGLVPGSMHSLGDGSGILGVGADGADLRITNEAPTSGTLSVTVTYFTIES